MAKTQDHYAVLGVPRDASADEIKRAYRRLTLESHPDRFPGDLEAERRFREVTEAYEVLGTPAGRARYDASVATRPFGLDLSRATEAPSATELLGNVFGDVFGSRRRTRRAGRDVRYTLTVSFEESILGSAHKVEFETLGPCSTCDGTGTRPGGRPATACDVCQGTGEVKGEGLFARRTKCGRCDGTGMIQLDPCQDCRGKGSRRERRAFNVNLPPGTESGAEKILRGMGEPGRFGGEAGDLRITVNVTPHDWLRRSGEDIVAAIPVSPSQVALGARVEVPTVDGWVELSVPAGMADGARLRLRGKGVPSGPGKRGDQLVELKVETPAVDRLPARAAEELRRVLERLEAVILEHPETLPRRRGLLAAAREADAAAEGESAPGDAETD